MNIKTKQIPVMLVCLAALASPVMANADVAVIANPAFASDAVDAEDIKRLFLGKTKQLAGAGATPVDQKSGNAAWEHFYDSVVGKSASQLRAYWSRLVFTGKGKPPKTLGGDEEIVAAVAGNETLIGYVDASAVTGDVKVLLTIP